MMSDTEQPNHSPLTRTRLLSAAAQLFAEKGYSGSSIRNICTAADASLNSVHYYFGSKDGLRQALLDNFSSAVLATPLRILTKNPESAEELDATMTLLFEETLHALIDNRHMFTYIMRENITAQACSDYGAAFIAFLERAQSRKLVRDETEPAMLTGWLFSRLGEQVANATWIKDMTGSNVIEDAAYRTEWLRANLDLFLYGIATRK